MIVDEIKEQVLGNFQKKCSETGCQLKKSKLQYPWHNAAGGSIWEPKHKAGRKMTKSGSAKRLWDNFLKLYGLIYLHMALDIYKINREVH